MKMGMYMTIYSFFIYIDILSEVIMVIIRSVGFVSYAVKLNFFIFIPFCITTDYFFIFIMEYGIWSVLVCFVLGMHIVAICNIWKLKNFSWDFLIEEK